MGHVREWDKEWAVSYGMGYGMGYVGYGVRAGRSRPRRRGTRGAQGRWAQRTAAGGGAGSPVRLPPGGEITG